MQSGRLILALTSLLWGFVQAPFDHIHPNEDLDHEITAAPVHVHGHEWLQEPGAGIAPLTADDDEVDVLWSVTTTAHFVAHTDASLVSRVQPPELTESAAPRLIPQHRGHDPPQYRPTAPRAPPA